MSFSFNEDFAQRFGLPEAVLLQHFQYWIQKNKADGRHQHDGRTWTYGTPEGMAQYFPFWTPKVIRRILESLRQQGVLLAGNYNSTAYDRTLWYAFVDEEAFLLPPFPKKGKSIYPKGENPSPETGQIDLPEAGNPSPESGPPIPDTEPDTKQEKKTTRASDRAADVFAIVHLEKTGVPYQWQKADFVHLAKLRKAWKLKTDEDPKNWDAAVLNYFASPLSRYTMADLCTRYSIFMNSPLNRYNKPTTHEALGSDIDRLQEKIRQEMAARRAVN